ncbi:MAG TPA: hydrogenase [Bacteroidota bacterium]|nr:hydrogenase [Bacteroidota bacterium]
MTSLSVQNHQSFAVADIPIVSVQEFETSVLEALAAHSRMVGLFGMKPAGTPGRVIAVLANRLNSSIHIVGTDFSPALDRYHSFAAGYPQTNYFECELAENHRIVPEGHPWLRPVRKQTTVLGDQPYSMYSMEGEEVHEVAVGPIHAGVIEPGHFRFQCHGELVYHLEINLGYQHRGIESLLLTAKPQQRSILCESIAGDTVIGHTMAYTLAVESLSHATVSLRAQVFRSIAEELERIAMHIAGLGGVANDVGYAIGASSYGRLRTLVINSLALICGSRFGRGFIVPGGLRFDPDDSALERVIENLRVVQSDIAAINTVMIDATSVVSRLDHTGVVSKEWAKQIGMVGPAARACGVEIDTRSQFPYGAYRYTHLPLTTLSTGDVFARTRMRSFEIDESLQFIFDQLETLAPGPVKNIDIEMQPDSGVISLVEGWRGEIAHCVFTDAAGKLSRYKIKDPSFHNWYGLALALRSEAISDFPLCNKSFDLSYAGHDL